MKAITSWIPLAHRYASRLEPLLKRKNIFEPGHVRRNDARKSAARFGLRYYVKPMDRAVRDALTELEKSVTISTPERPAYARFKRLS
jgi:hypothetical protein